MIVQANNDTGACYGVAKCAAVVFEREREREKMLEGEVLQALK